MIYLKQKKIINKLKKKIKKNDKSCNISKFVSVLRSASVERVDVSRMRDLKKIICQCQGRGKAEGDEAGLSGEISLFLVCWKLKLTVYASVCKRMMQ